MEKKKKGGWDKSVFAPTHRPSPKPFFEPPGFGEQIKITSKNKANIQLSQHSSHQLSQHSSRRPRPSELPGNCHHTTTFRPQTLAEIRPNPPGAPPPASCVFTRFCFLVLLIRRLLSLAQPLAEVRPPKVSKARLHH